MPSKVIFVRWCCGDKIKFCKYRTPRCNSISHTRPHNLLVSSHGIVDIWVNTAYDSAYRSRTSQLAHEQS